MLGAPALVGEAILLLTALAWLAVVGAQFWRAVQHRQEFIADLVHPVRVAFAAAPTIGLMILAGALFPYLPEPARLLWVVAVALHLLVAMMLLRRIVAGRGQVAMLAPPLMIPFVGNILAPIMGAPMGFAQASWAMFGVGLLLWLMLKPLLLHRLLAGPALPPPLQPAIAIFLAPPAAGALALAALTGGVSGPVLMLAGLAVLVAAVLLSLVQEIRSAPFGPAWWGLTFPTAAFAIMLIAFGAPAILGWAALALTTGVTGYVAVGTLRALAAGAWLRPEH